ncbi:MAG: LamG-like jellyroll fold domain-containing protein [Ferruginibacter sp.]
MKKFSSIISIAFLLITVNLKAQEHKVSTPAKDSITNKYQEKEDDENESIEAAEAHSKRKWFTMMSQPQVSYFKVQKKFTRYFKKHPLEGSAPREYGTGWLKTKIFYLDKKGRVQAPPFTDYNNITKGLSGPPPVMTDTMSGDWRMIGPRNILPAVAGSTGGNNGGYGYCVRIDPTNSNKLFISFVTGGLWMSEDNGNAWHLADANLPANSYYDIDVCNADNNIVYAVSKSAVIKSTDGGFSWNPTTLNSTNYTGQAYDIAASHTDPNLIVARWGNNIYRSTDGGTTWSVIKTGLKNFSIWDSNLNSEVLDFDNSNNSIVYFTDRGDNQNYVDVYKSNDAGASFSLFQTLPLAATATGTVTGWSKICTATNSPNAVYVLVGSGTSSYVHTAVQMYKLDIVTGNIISQRTNMIDGINTGYGSPTSLHHGDIAMDISDDNKIVWGSYSQGNAQYSIDNGVSFSTSTSSVHSDLRGVYMINGKVILATDGSTVVSTDNGNHFTIVSNSISNHELWGFGAAFKSDLLAAGCNHGPLMLREYEAPGGWYTLLGADQGNSDFNPLDSVSAYSQGYDSYHITRTGIKTFTNAGQQIDPGGIYSYFNTMEFHPNLFHTLITHHAGQYPSSVPQATKDIWKNSLIRSDDNGLTVKVIHTFSSQLFREKICMTDTNRIYAVVGLTNNSLMKTADGGATWTDITPSTSVTTASVKNISDIAVADVNPNEIWVSYSGVQNNCQVLHSIDGGITYVNITSPTLTNNPITKMIFQRGTDGGIYVGNASGIYYKNNSLSDWVKLGNGLPQMDIRYLFINYYKGKLITGTSRGAWDHDLYEHSATKAQISAATRTPNCQNPTVQFRDYSVVSEGGTGTTYSWSFPGGTPSTSTSETPVISYAGASAGSHDVSLTVTDQYGTSTQSLPGFINYDISNCCQAAPAPWQLTDIGTATIPGTVCYTQTDMNYKITTQGAGLTDPNDAFTFLNQPLVGDGQIIARVKDVSSVYNYSAGIMVRNNLAANSSYIFLNSLDTRGVFDLWRSTDGGNTGYHPVTSYPTPMWLRLQRKGTTITSAYSADGITWTTYNNYNITLNASIYVGLAVAGTGNSSDMDSVSVGPLPPFVCNGGSVNGCPALDTIPGKAINFYDYTYFNIPVSTAATNTFTITGWIKPQGVLGQQASIMAWDNGYFYMGQGNDNQLEYVWNSGDASNTWNSGLFAPADKWSFVAMVIHPDSASLYLNDKMATDVISQGMSAVANGILGNSNPGAGYFLGQMDELSVWNRALSTDEIDSLRHLTKENFAAPSSPKHDPALISYFQFNDSTSTSSYNLIDSSSFAFGGGADKINSTIPVGAGSSGMQTVNAGGNYIFGSTGATLNFPSSGTHPNGNIWVTKINQLPDQYPHSSVMPNAYWIVNNYGADSAFSPTVSLQMNNSINVSAADASAPGSFKLFKRLSNDDGYTWGNFNNSATSATAGTSGNITFNPANITSEGQLFINGGTQAPKADSAAGYMLDLTPTGNPVISLSPVPINSNTFTIMMWVKPKGLQKVFSQIISSQAPNTRFGIGFAFPGYTDNLNLVFTNTAINYGQQSTINLVADQWNHIALTYSPDSVSIYLNGGDPWTFPKASSLTPAGFPPVDFSQVPVTVNADIHGQGGNYKGQVDEICFYKYQLSQQEIREKMHLVKNPVAENGLVGYYQFNQYNATTNTLYDAMGNGTTSTVAPANIAISTAAIGAGISYRIPNVNAAGSYYFPGTGAAITFPGPTVPNGEMVVTRLYSQPDSLPSGYPHLNNNYWVIHNWGSNAAFTATTAIKFDGLNISAADASAPGVLKLLKRSSNEFLNNWSLLGGAVAATSGSNGSATFDNSINNSSFSQFLIATTGSSVLPVKLTSFTGKKQPSGILLQWKVASEFNFNHYEIESSADGISFKKIAAVKGANAANYSYTDNQPLAGNNFYRLRMVDNDNGYSYSNIVVVTLENIAFLRITPNPAYGNLVITVSNLDDVSAQLFLYSSDGRLYRKYTIAPNGNIKITGLPKGSFVYKATNAKGKAYNGIEIVE